MFAYGWFENRGHPEPMLSYVEKGDNKQSDFQRFVRERIKWDDRINEPEVRESVGRKAARCTTYSHFKVRISPRMN